MGDDGVGWDWNLADSDGCGLRNNQAPKMTKLAAPSGDSDAFWIGRTVQLSK